MMTFPIRGVLTMVLATASVAAFATSIYNPDRPEDYTPPKQAASQVVAPQEAQPVPARQATYASSTQKIELLDGSTVYLFENGKMGMEDRYGRPTRMQPGASMQTKDGRVITMTGDETARVSKAQYDSDKAR